MNNTEKYGMILLFFACLFMAGLNLWLIFKEWFNDNYAKKSPKEDTPNYIGKSKSQEDLIIGESKFNLQREKERYRQLVQEVESLKRELRAMKENEIIYSVPLSALKEENVTSHPLNGQSVSSEEDIELNTYYTKEDAELAGNQSITVDQFELMVKSLSGKKITYEESQQVAEILPQMKGTDIFQQFLKQVKSAEVKVGEIIGWE